MSLEPFGLDLTPEPRNRAFCPPRLHYFGNEGGWIKNTYAAIKEFISKPAVEPIAAAVRSPEKPQSSTEGAQPEEGS